MRHRFPAGNLPLSRTAGVPLAGSPYHPIDVADVVGVLGTEVAGVLRLYLPVRLLSCLAFSKATSWASVRMRSFYAAFASSDLRRLRKVSRSCRSHMERTPPGEPSMPFSSARCWPASGHRQASQRPYQPPLFNVLLEETSEQLGVPLNTLKSRIHHGRKKMRGTMADF